MDEHFGKRGFDQAVVPRNGLGHLLRDTANTRDQNGRLCSRLGCSSRVKSPEEAQICSSASAKGKSLRSSIQSPSSGKKAVGSSSRTTSNPGKHLIEPQKTLSYRLGRSDSLESSSLKEEHGISDLIPPPEENPRGLQSEMENTKSSNYLLMELGCSSVVSNTRSQRNFQKKPGLQEIKSTGPMTRAVTSRYGLRNLRCNSISDIIPAGCSSSDSTLNRGKDTIKKRNCEGESSSTGRGKKMTGTWLEGRNSGSRNGICISDSRRSRNIPPQRDNNTASASSRRSISGHARGRLSNNENENPIAPNESSVMIPMLSCSGDLDAICISHHTCAEASLSHPSSYSRSGTSTEQVYSIMPVSPAEYGINRSLLRNGLLHYNMDGIAEVLLSLEMIEQEEDLTHEQILQLETNLFLDGLNIYDHHRDMRLDIDNMSYEELLALEERMGTVSTALTEEALSECLKRSIFKFAHSDDAAESCNEHKDDIKCSICQEEYMIGDEMGSLQCKHRFHVVCIQQWLRLKNWCPICKVSAAPSNSC